MGHDWIFEVLADLRSYAEQNDLPMVADKAAELLRVARAEVAAKSRADADDPSSGRMN